MVDWVFVLTPLLVLPIVLLFRFVGCGTQLVVDPDTVSYRDYIMGEFSGPAVMPVVPNPTFVPKNENVIAYWRLVGTGSTATDEKGVHHGEYREGQPVDNIAPTTVDAGSDAAPGTFDANQQSLVISDNVAKCRTFFGGYVFVPFNPNATTKLYTDEFTIEAWVDTQWTPKPGYEHTLFSAGGHYVAPYDTTPAFHGFEVLATHVDGLDRWQVRLHPHVGDVFPPRPPIVPRGVATHVAVTVEKDGVAKKVRLFVNGGVAAIATVGFYSLPDGAPLYIGIWGAPQPVNPPVLRKPILSRIQEVVLHKKALSPEEIQNHVSLGS
jgi:hypothetical protein